ncbi:MAG: GNAT family N-acetyltransferase [Anaerolineaceae bacterium]
MSKTNPNWTIKPLSSETWPAFEQLAAKHNGVWGGCWCTWFHGNTGRLSKEESNHDYKGRLTKTGQAHAALVFEGDQAIAWCQFGSPTELPRVHSKKLYQSLDLQPPDYRITCFFVDTDYRKQGVATIAIQGALDMIASLGGGLVEAFPWNLEKKKTSSSMLFVGTLAMFTKLGFETIAPLGGNLLLVRKNLLPAIF